MAQTQYDQMMQNIKKRADLDSIEVGAVHDESSDDIGEDLERDGEDTELDMMEHNYIKKVRKEEIQRFSNLSQPNRDLELDETEDRIKAYVSRREELERQLSEKEKHIQVLN